MDSKDRAHKHWQDSRTRTLYRRTVSERNRNQFCKNINELNERRQSEREVEQAKEIASLRVRCMRTVEELVRTVEELKRQTQSTEETNKENAILKTKLGNLGRNMGTSLDTFERKVKDEVTIVRAAVREMT